MNKSNWFEWSELNEADDDFYNPSFNQSIPTPSLQSVDVPTNNQLPSNSNDPLYPDMPEDIEAEAPEDFETWKANYMKVAIDGDSNELLTVLDRMMERMVNSEALTAIQRKFIWDNYQIQILRQDANIANLSGLIRRKIKEQPDVNSVAISLMDFIHTALETDVVASEVFIKLTGLYALKGELHRKFIAGLLGTVQVGGGGDMEDMILSEKEYSAEISTRFGADFTEINLGSWSLQEDDPDKFLTDAELQRLEDGSPEEKNALLHRIILESIASRFNQRHFLIHITIPDGTTYGIGWDIADSLKLAFTDGKLIVKTKNTNYSSAVLSEQGKIVPLSELSINFLKNSNRIDATGNTMPNDIPFISWRDGTLYFVGSLETTRSASMSISNLSLKELPFNGNPAQMMQLTRCVPNVHEILMRRC